MNRERIEKISKALADQTRLTIFEAIAKRGQMNCGEIVGLQGVTPATVSHHLKILSEANLIECRRQGQFVFSKAIPVTMNEYTHALAAILKTNKTVKEKRARKRNPSGGTARASDVP